MVPSRFTPSTPDGPASARNAVATTIVGSTNGTVASALMMRFPGNE